MNEKMYVKMLDVCCWVARRKSQVGGGLASNLYIGFGRSDSNRSGFCQRPSSRAPRFSSRPCIETYFAIEEACIPIYNHI